MTHPGLGGLAGQVALVSGATRGIGRATAALLARHGAQVAVVARNPVELDALATALAAGDRLLTLRADVADYRQVDDAVGQLLRWSDGRLDILVNNAGYPVEEPLWSTPFHELPGRELDALFDRVARVDLAGARHLTHAALPAMMARQTGSIVFVSSTPALAGHQATPYTEAKAAILGLMRDTAVNYARYQIRANAVAPGNIRTGWADSFAAAQQAALAREARLGRWGEAEEVAQAILFFASPMSSFITGQTLVVDGGRVIH